MRLGLTGEHRAFYAKHRFLEVQDLLSGQECQDLKSALSRSLASSVKGMRLQQVDSALDRRLRAGRDLSRKEAHLRKMVCRPTFAGVVSELTRTRLVRLAFDHAFVSTEKALIKGPFWASPHSLEQLSSVQGVVGGLLINLGMEEGEPLPVPEEEGAQNIFTQTGGSGVFFDKDLPIDFSQFAQSEHKAYILIAYAQQRALYRKADGDPALHELKNLGYAFGDQLKEGTHPTLFR